MPTCVRCGRELPSSAGQYDPLCRDCRAIAAVDPSFLHVKVAILPRRPGPANRFSLTQIIVGINVLGFRRHGAFGSVAVTPTVQQLVIWGANFAPLSLGLQPWRILASNYVHIGIIHIFFNMWCLWNLGRLAERIFDRWTYLMVYTASGIGGSLASLWWHPRGIGAGASGAIFGLAGGLIAVLYLGKLPIAKEALKPTLKSLISSPPTTCFSAWCRASTTPLILEAWPRVWPRSASWQQVCREPPDIRARRRNYVVIGTTALLLAGYSYLKQKSGPVAPPATTLFVIPTGAKRSEQRAGRESGRARVHSCR